MNTMGLLQITELMPSKISADDFLDLVERVIAEVSQEFPVDLPLEHTFTPGIYVRKIFMPKGAIGTSRIHKTEHPFAILQGKLSVYTPNEGIIQYEAPFMGITKPGTRRLLYIHEDTVWATFHATDKTDPEEIINEITYMRPTTLALKMALLE